MDFNVQDFLRDMRREQKADLDTYRREQKEDLDAYRQEQKSDHDIVLSKLDGALGALGKHDTRLTVLEGFRKNTRWLAGTVIGTLITAIVTAVMSIFHR